MSTYIVTEFYIGLFLNNLCEKAPGGFCILMVLRPFQKKVSVRYSNPLLLHQSPGLRVRPLEGFQSNFPLPSEGL